MPPIAFNRTQQTHQPRRYQNYRNPMRIEYQKQRIIDRSVNNPRLQNSRRPPDLCPKCGYAQCMGGRTVLHLTNDVITVNIQPFPVNVFSNL